MTTTASLLALLSSTPARAYVPEQTPHRDAEAAAAQMLAQPPARATLPGIVIMRGSKMILGINARRPMTPASLVKLATTAAAVRRFGPSHRFATRVVANGRHGSTVTTLTLVGGGDPTFATETYRRARFLPKPDDRIKRPAFASGSPTVEQLAARVAARGIRTVTGDLIADESLFDTRRTQPGWLPSYLGPDPDTGLLTALSINEGRGDLKGKTIVPDPAAAAGRALRDALAARGVEIHGTVRAGVTPRGAIEVARVRSPPLAEMVGFINRYSINFHAEVLLKSLGAAFGGSGTTTAGTSIVRAELTRLNVPLNGTRLEDGSGLSLLDRMTPLTVATLVDRILTRRGDVWDALRASLPLAGDAGTLEKRMATPPTAGNLRGKTGQVKHVRAMAGWVTASDGVPLVYVAIFNGTPSPFALTAPLDLFGLLLARYPGA